ncbi:MAG: HAD family phosphatase [Elusimicrobiota bacterium]
MKNKITTFIFDIGNVLIFFDNQTIVKKFEKFSGIPAKEIYDSMFDASFINSFETGRISEQTFYQTVCSKLSIKISFPQFKEIFSDIFTPNASIDKLVKKLKGKYKLCILSNVGKTHFEYLQKRYPIMNIFDSYYLSYKLHAMKPETRIFNAVLKGEKVKPGECVYTDDIERNVLKAKKLGINAIQFKSANQFKKSLKKFNINI